MLPTVAHVRLVKALPLPFARGLFGMGQGFFRHASQLLWHALTLPSAWIVAALHRFQMLDRFLLMLHAFLGMLDRFLHMPAAVGQRHVGRRDRHERNIETQPLLLHVILSYAFLQCHGEPLADWFAFYSIL